MPTRPSSGTGVSTSPEIECSRFNVLALLFLVFAWAWKFLDSIYRQEVVDLHWSDSVRGLSWVLSDTTYMPDGTEGLLRPLWGMHYFGDLQIFFGYVNSENPYSPTLLLPAQIPPSGLLLYKLIYVGGSIGLLALIGTFFVLPFLGIWLWNSSEPIHYRISVFLIAAVFPVWSVIAFDRGNVLPIASSFLLVSLWYLRTSKNSTIWATLFFLCGISLKPQIGIVCIFLILVGQLVFVVRSILILFVLNTFLFLTYNGTVWANWVGLVKSVISYQDPKIIQVFSRENVMSLYGLLQRLRPWDVNEGFTTESWILDHPRLPVVLVSFLVLIGSYVTLQNRLPRWIQLTVWLAISQLGVAATGTYGSAWLIVCIPLFGKTLDLDSQDSLRRFPVAGYVALIASLLSMMPFQVHRTFSPVAWLIFILVVFVETALRRSELALCGNRSRVTGKRVLGGLRHAPTLLRTGRQHKRGIDVSSKM